MCYTCGIIQFVFAFILWFLLCEIISSIYYRTGPDIGEIACIGNCSKPRTGKKTNPVWSIDGLTNEQSFRYGDPTINHVASKWRLILGQIHSTVPATALREALHDFVTMPPERTQNDNELLMKHFLVAEVHPATTSLS